MRYIYIYIYDTILRRWQTGGRTAEGASRLAGESGLRLIDNTETHHINTAHIKHNA